VTSQAWQNALAGPADRSAWRVWADELLSAGDPRGEWLQLELDAEEGPLRGLARGRLMQLREEGLARILPPGVEVAHAKTWRSLLISARVHVARAAAPEDPRWFSVRHLSFFFQTRPPTIAQWRRTPLVAGSIDALDSVTELELEGLQVLAEGPPRPRLTRVGGLWPLGRVPAVPPTEFVRAWRSVLARHPGVADVHLGWLGPIDGASRVLEPLLDPRLTRCSVEGSPDELPGYDAWVRDTGFAGELVVELRQTSLLRASVVVGRDVLVLRAVPRVAQDATRSVQDGFSRRGLSARVTLAPPLAGIEPFPPPR